MLNDPRLPFASLKLMEYLNILQYKSPIFVIVVYGLYNLFIL